MGDILVGTSSWTDPTLLDSGWYPANATTAEARLAYYASQFPVVEVDASYYAPPSERNSILWVERTPPHFTFNIKAYSLLTQHPTQVRSLPRAVRDAAEATGKRSVYQKDLAPDAVDEVFEMFRSALMPLHSAGKLGFVLFQFPEWFVPSAANKEYIRRCAERLPDYRLAIEFRRRTWMDPADRAERTLAWLRDLNLPYVCLDMPQGFPSSMPDIAAATTGDLAIVRFHGRNARNWKRKGITVAERFDDAYSEEELRSWQPRLFDLASKTKRTHVMFNNCYRDKGVRNAAQLADLVREVDA